jgi:asparagine synthase (glutamine-hydrolysing)
MCGIIGQLNLRQPVDSRLFDAMRDTLAHRGPDGYGSWLSADCRLALGHRRLAFLDLSAEGRQPMSDCSGSVHITFNGEIYNYRELRQQLTGEGWQFRSQTDTEVLLYAYRQWGTGMLSRLKGMFAFGLWDEKKRQLLLARDRFGIKPLYYGWSDGNFYFASELKAILRGLPQRPPLRQASLADFLSYRYIPSPHTIWENFYKLPPASFLLLSGGQVKVETYWQLRPGSDAPDEQEAAMEVGRLLVKSMHEHRRSDVPVGNFLSGGYDSSALTALSVALGYDTRAFSIGFRQWDKSEHLYAADTARALGVALDTTLVGDEQLALCGQLAYHYDEPLGDISTIPTYMVSQLASGHCKAVLSGEGADEIFGGYTWQHAVAGWPAAMARLAQPGRWGRQRVIRHYAEAMAMGRFGRENLTSILHPRLHTSLPPDSDWFYRRHYLPWQPPLKNVQNLDIQTFMSELVLTKIDRASMAHSLEVRVPFLDHELVEYMFSLHPSVYYRPGRTKFLLWKNIRPLLPAAVFERPKQGFVGPDVYYMHIDWYRQQLQQGCLLADEVIRPEGLAALLQQKSHWHLWKLLVLEKWWQQWMR